MNAPLTPYQLYTVKYLNGRVEKVYINSLNNDNSANGVWSDIPIIVSRAQNYVGKYCIVRFDCIRNKFFANPTANFLTSKILPSFEGLTPYKYILVAPYILDIPKEDSSPDYSDVAGLYEPGQMNFFTFFKDDFKSTNTAVKVDVKNNKVNLHGGITEILARRLGKPEKLARIVVAEVGILEEIVHSVEKLHLVPILLEPIGRNGK